MKDPKPLPGRCKTPGEIDQMKRPIVAASQSRRDAAVASFVADHHLTLDGGILPPRDAGGDRDGVTEAISNAFRPDRELTRIDLGRATWSQVIVEPLDEEHQPCARHPAPPTAYQLAHDETGTTVVLRMRTARHVVSSATQCGTCYLGCGIPVNGSPWTAVVLPLAAGVPYRIETLDLVDDEVVVWCEDEQNAM